MDFFINLTLSDYVGLAGVFGFALSVVLAITQMCSSRLRIGFGDFERFEYAKVPGSVFMHVFLYNKSRIPFSLISIHIQERRNSKEIPIEQTLRTFRRPVKKDRLGVEPVLLSPAFPVRFDSYAGDEIWFEVSRLRIAHLDLTPHPDVPVRNLAEPLRRLCSRIRRRCTRRLLPVLVLHTSRGRRVIPIRVSSVGGSEEFELYAIRKAGCEEKLVFPSDPPSFFEIL